MKRSNKQDKPKRGWSLEQWEDFKKEMKKDYAEWFCNERVFYMPPYTGHLNWLKSRIR